MAGQKPAGRGTRQGAVARSSPTARPDASKQKAGNAAGTGKPRSTAGGSAAGNRAGSSRPGGNRAAAATAIAPAKTGTRAAAASVTEPSGGLFRRVLQPVWSPFRSMGGLPLATLILSLYGLGASIYLTIAHYDTQVTLACSDKGLINCEEVTTSSQSIVFGIFPVAVLGLAFYIFMVAVNSPWGWRLKSPLVRWARFGSVIVGMGFVLYLIYAEVDQIHAICLWCTSVHVATFLIFVLLVFHTAFNWERPAAARQE